MAFSKVLMQSSLVVASAFVVLPFAGCLGDGGSGDAASDGEGRADTSSSYREGVVIHNQPFTASSASPATFTVTVEEGTRDMVLEIQQDSGVMPNLHVELTGCGGVDTPASASWQNYPLCDPPQSGTQTLTISVKAGSPAGTGRALLRADLVSP